MPFVEELIEVDGKLQLFFDKEDQTINICIYNQRFCDTYNIDVGAKVTIKKILKKIDFSPVLFRTVKPKQRDHPLGGLSVL